MAAAVVERVWRDSTPESVEEDLAVLWRDIAKHDTIARAVMSNLVLFRFHERRTDRARAADTPALDAALEAVTARHPSRAIVIEHDRGEHGASAPSGAGVSVCVFGPPGARYGVEQVVVRSACAEVSLPSIVRRFARGDLPTTIWWTEDLSRHPPLPALIETGRQLLYDSRSWRDVQAGFRAVAPIAAAARVDLADLNWRRLAPVRRVLVHAAEHLPADAVRAPMRITHRPGDAALAWLLAGWLASRLRWRAGDWPPIDEARRADEVLTLALGENGSMLTVTLNGHRVLLRQAGIAPVTVPVPHDSEPDAIAAELRSLSHETALRDALAALAAVG